MRFYLKTNRIASARLSVLLPGNLHARLVRYAAREGISLSEAVRRTLDAGLFALEHQASSVEEHRDALAAMRRFREEMAERYGVYQGDLVAEVRAERERQMDQVLRPDLVSDEDRELSS